jgi:hypothetical protein
LAWTGPAVCSERCVPCAKTARLERFSKSTPGASWASRLISAPTARLPSLRWGRCSAWGCASGQPMRRGRQRPGGRPAIPRPRLDGATTQAPAGPGAERAWRRRRPPRACAPAPPRPSERSTADHPPPNRCSPSGSPHQSPTGTESRKGVWCRRETRFRERRPSALYISPPALLARQCTGDTSPTQHEHITLPVSPVRQSHVDTAGAARPRRRHRRRRCS